MGKSNMISVKKRQKTHDQLVQTAVTMLADDSFSSSSILQIATTAGVSNGTFYNYFQSKDQLMEAAALSISEQMAWQLRRQFEGVEDPAQRVVIAAFTFMGRVLEDAEFGWALMRLAGTLPKMSEAIRSSVLMDVREGLEKGRFHFSSEVAAIDLVLGTLMSGIRTLLDGGQGREYMPAIAQISLVGLGMTQQQANDVVQRVVKRTERHE